MAIGTTTNMQWLGGQGGAAVRYTGENGVIVNNSTNKISADFDAVQHKLTQGSNITISNNNVISAQQPDVSQFVTGSEVTTQIENAIANVREVPASDSSDLNKVLTADANNGYSWQPVPTPPIYTAGNGIDLTNNAISAKVDGTTITTNSQGQLVATGGGSPSTTIHVVNTDTSTLIAQGSSGLYFTQNFTVNLPSTGIYEFDIATFEDVILNISPTNPGTPWEEKYIADGFSHIVDMGYSRNKDYYQLVKPDYDAYRISEFLNGYGISYIEMYCNDKWCYTVDNVQHHYMGKKVHGKVWINDTTKVPTGLYIAERSAFGATLSQVVSVRCELFFKKIGDLPQWTLANA